MPTMPNRMSQAATTPKHHPKKVPTAKAVAMKAVVLELRAEATAQMHGAALFVRILSRRWNNNSQLIEELV